MQALHIQKPVCVGRATDHRPPGHSVGTVRKERHAWQLRNRVGVQHRQARQSHLTRASSVEAKNKVDLSHTVSENSFEVKGDLQKVFLYAADFSHISGWDTGAAKPSTVKHMFFMQSSSIHSDLRTGTVNSHLRGNSSRGAFQKGDTVALMTVLFGIQSSCV